MTDESKTKASISKASTKQSEVSFSFPLKLSRKPNAILADLSELGFGNISSHGGKLEVCSVQSTELDSSPHDYIKAVFSANSLVLSYTVPAKANPAQRRIEAAAWLLHILSSANATDKLPQALLSFISDSLDAAGEVLSSGTGELSSQLAEAKSENTALKAKYSRLISEHEGQARSLLDATRKAEEAHSKLERLNLPSDETLDEEVMEWLRAHGGKIDVRQFADSRSLPPSSIEESLKRLSHGGFIARI